MTLTDIDKIEAAFFVLMELRSLLEREGETNWCRGIDSAINELTNEDGTLNVSGFENACSIFRTMTAGGRGFSEYYISRHDEVARIKVNQKLDDLRSKAWALFGK